MRGVWIGVSHRLWTMEAKPALVVVVVVVVGLLIHPHKIWIGDI